MASLDSILSYYPLHLPICISGIHKGLLNQEIYPQKLIDSFRQDFKYFSAVPNARRIDVTDQLEEENVLSVFLDRFVVVFWQDVPHREDHHTIAIDNVWLECAPSRVSLKSAISFPSFRKKSVEMRATVLNPAGERGTAKVDFRYGRTGDNRNFSKTFRLTGEKEQRIVGYYDGRYAWPALPEGATFSLTVTDTMSSEMSL